MFTELRMITEVMGSPPIIPDVTFPIPWASNSRLAGEVRCCGSSLSTASRFSNVSSEATAAIVAAEIETAGFDHCEKSGNCKKARKPAKLSATGT